MAKNEKPFEPGRSGQDRRSGRGPEDRKRTQGGFNKGEKKVFNRNDKYTRPDNRDESRRNDSGKPNTDRNRDTDKPGFSRSDRDASEKRSAGRYSRSDEGRGGERKSYGNRNAGSQGEGRSYGGARKTEGRSYGNRPYQGRDAEGRNAEKRDGFKPRDNRSDETRPARSFSNDRPERQERRFSSDRPRRADDDRKRDAGFSRKPYADRDRDRPNRRENPDAEKRTERRFNPILGRRAESSPQEVPDYTYKPYKERVKRKNEDDGTIRLNRYIANAGVCSRREADTLIESGEIKVNGQVVTEMGYKVQPNDTVQYGKKVLNRQKLVYVLLNKPKDFITTTEDPEGRKTVMELVAGATTERIFPVGRLDRNTTGLLLFTNDGELAQKLTHPSFKSTKIYQVELDKPITNADFESVRAGVELEDGKADVDDVAVLSLDKKILGLEIHIGRNRIVRRIFEHLGYEVVALDRVQYASLTKKDLPRGSWRYLTEKEVIRLKYFM